MKASIPDWVADAVFYQIFPDRFARNIHSYPHGVVTKYNLQAWGSVPTFHGFQGGNLRGIEDKLPYLADLGITAVYLNPIFSSASNHRYHTHDYFQVDPLLGTMADFERLVETAHAHNIRLILDGVFNHASRGFFQFNHLLECRQESPYADWFHVYNWPVNAYQEHEPPNYAAWWGLHALPKFNTNNTAVREFLWRVGTFWLEKGIDGWRLDVPNEIDDDTFWQEFRRRCRSVNPEAYIVGELWGESQRWLQGDQFDAQMNYPLTRAILGFFLGNNMDRHIMERTGYGYVPTLDGRAFAHQLENLFCHLYPPEVVLAQLNLLGSHDTPRIRSVARGQTTAVLQMMLCLFTVPGVPMIYYGDEIGLEGAQDPHCRGAFPWHDETSWDKPFQAQLKQIIQLRHTRPALRHGQFKWLAVQRHAVMFQREYNGENVVVAFNRSEKPAKMDCPDHLSSVLLPEMGDNSQRLTPASTITLPGHGYAVWATPRP